MEISNLFVFKTTSIKDALKVIDQHSLGSCILVDENNHFLRIVTDGDIRRLLISGQQIEQSLDALEVKKAIVVTKNTPLAEIHALFKQHDIQTIPVLNDNNTPIDLISRKHLENPILLSYPHLSGGEMDYIQQAFDTNWIAPLGPNVENFEKELAEYVGIGHALAVSSGTAALHLALDVLNIRAGDIVFCSSFTFVASVNPILYHGALPVFIDSDLETWNMSPDALLKGLEHYKAIGKLPKAVIVVDLYGQSADLNALREICQQFNVPIIQDSAESLGASYHGKKAGTLGDIGFYSFNGNKIITTSGGGMLISDNEDLIKNARFLSTQAKDPADFYLHHRVGYNYRMSNILAGVGRGQLKVLDSRVQKRREIFETYQRELAHIDGIQWMPEPEGYFSTRWLSCLVIDPEKLSHPIEYYYKQFVLKGIEVRRLWKPMHTQPLYQQSMFFSQHDGMSTADNLFNHGLCLPSSSNMSVEQQYRIIDVVKHLLG